MASDELVATVEVMRKQKSIAAEGLSIADRRAAMEAMQASLPMPDDVKMSDILIDGIPSRWIVAPNARQDAYVIYFHGGGYVMGSLNTHQELMGRISDACRARVLGVDYRLAPEHEFPAAVDDGVKSYEWLIKQGADPSRIMVAGDSAGGGLAIAALLTLRDSGRSLPAGAFLFSPWTDLTASGDSANTRAEADPMITIPALLDIAKTYYGNANPENPLVSPLFAELAGLPPLLIQVGDAEVLLDDASRLAARAKLAGVTTHYQVWPDAFHVFQAVPHLPEASDALRKLSQFYNDII